MATRIVNINNKTNFTVISNVTLRDRRLSIAARGALAFMLSHSESYEFSRENLARDFGVGGAVAKRIFRELTEYGYLIRRASRLESGQIVGWDWTVFGVSQCPDDSTVGSKNRPTVKPLGCKTVGRKTVPTSRRNNDQEGTIRKEEQDGENASSITETNKESHQEVFDNGSSESSGTSLSEPEKPKAKTGKKEPSSKTNLDANLEGETIRREMRVLLLRKCYSITDSEGLKFLTKTNSIKINAEILTLYKLGIYTIHLKMFWAWYRTSGKVWHSLKWTPGTKLDVCQVRDMLPLFRTWCKDGGRTECERLLKMYEELEITDYQNPINQTTTTTSLALNGTSTPKYAN